MTRITAKKLDERLTVVETWMNDIENTPSWTEYNTDGDVSTSLDPDPRLYTHMTFLEYVRTYWFELLLGGLVGFATGWTVAYLVIRG
jgi:hypothetical protein